MLMFFGKKNPDFTATLNLLTLLGKSVQEYHAGISFRLGYIGHTSQILMTKNDKKYRHILGGHDNNDVKIQQCCGLQFFSSPSF